MNYSIGDTVTYATFDGKFRTGIVTHKNDHADSDLQGFDMIIPRNDETAKRNEWGCFWGYDHQIVDVKPA